MTLGYTENRHQLLQHVKDGGDPQAVDPGWTAATTTRTLHALLNDGLVKAVTTYELTEAGSRTLTFWDTWAEHERWLAGQEQP